MNIRFVTYILVHCFAGQAAAKTIIEMPDDNLFDAANTTSESESSAQQSNPDANEHASSMCALWSNSSIRYRYITPSLALYPYIVYVDIYIWRHYFASLQVICVWCVNL